MLYQAFFAELTVIKVKANYMGNYMDGIEKTWVASNQIAKDMGKIVSEMSDFVWLTSDNPRSEDPMKIIRQVASGITTGNYSVSLDRKDAIREAITSSQDQDIVMLLGKGDESTQEVNGVFLPFSDREIAKEVVGGLV